MPVMLKLYESDLRTDEERRADEREAAAARRVANDRADLLAAWLESGGTIERFEECWPAIQAGMSELRVAELVARARGRSLARLRKPLSPQIGEPTPAF